MPERFTALDTSRVIPFDDLLISLQLEHRPSRLEALLARTGVKVPERVKGAIEDVSVAVLATGGIVTAARVFMDNIHRIPGALPFP